MKILEILNYINKIAPFKYGEEFDNNGLLVGNENSEVKKILVAVDLTSDVLEKAINEKFDTIITHHPYIFEPIKRITDEILIGLIRNNVSYIALHTNYDNGRLTDLFAKKMQLKKIEKIHLGENGGFFGGIGQLERTVSLEQFISNIKDEFSISYIRLIGRKKDLIKTIAYGNGNTSYYINEIINNNFDVYITGEVKYHDELLYYNNNKFVISLGHYESEKMFSKDLKKQLTKEFSNLNIEILNNATSKIV